MSPIVPVERTFYMFGGKRGTNGKFYWIQRSISTIAAFSTLTKKWKNIGDLKISRFGHGVIFQRGEFIIIGGESFVDSGQKFSLSTERCTLKDDAIDCTVVDPMLEKYHNYPEMMQVPIDYCPK